MKRTPLKRSAPLRATAPAKLSIKVEKGRCKICRGPFVKFSLDHKVCRSEECAVAWSEMQRAKKAATAEKLAARAAIDDRKQTRAQLEALKTLKELRAEAQKEFNAYIRARDRKAGYGCICCGAPLDWNSTKPGGAVDAGHYLSRGSCPELAFVEMNVNAQRKGCNRPGGAIRDDFRAGMVRRYGEAAVAALEGPQSLPHLRHDDYRHIRDTYRAKARAIERQRTAEMEPA